MKTPELRTSTEKSWSYDTPYDIVRRQELLEQGDCQRVEDIDTYIAFINEEMSADYMVETRLSENGGKQLKRNPAIGTRIFKRNEGGIYEPHCTVAVVGQFYGDKVFLAEENPVVINQEVGLGVTPSEYVKFTSPASINTEYASERKYREKIFASTVRKMLSLEKGKVYDFSDWYNGYM